MQNLLIAASHCPHRFFFLRIGPFLLAGGLLFGSDDITAQEFDAATRKHPAAHALMPGVVGRGLADPDWPRTQHDALASGFSPLVCDMQEAPVVWSEIEVGGGVNFLAVVEGPGGRPHLLMSDKHLKLLTSAGKTAWSRSAVGHLLGAGDLRGDGGRSALFSAGPRVILIDLANGQELWRHEFEPVYCSATGQVADILPEEPGLEAAIFLTHGEEGCVISFLPNAAPEIVWQRKVVAGEFNERYDHHNGTIAIDLSRPDEPVIWNLRRHRCRGFDARTGNRLSTITYDIGDGQKRNYGPVHLGRGKDGQPLACVFGERVQVHSHAIRIYRDRDNELAWHHYYGEVYKEAPGVTMTSHGLVDFDGDGGHEMVYSVRDPSADYRSIVRFRSAEAGEIKIDLPDQWGIGTFQEIGPERRSGLLTLSAPQGRTPSRGELNAYQFSDQGKAELVGTLQSAGTWGPTTIAGEMGDELLLREKTPDGRQSLSRFRIEAGELVRTASTTAENLLAEPILAILAGAGPLRETFVTQSAGRLCGISWNGAEQWSVPIASAVASAVSAADLNGDGLAELAAATPDRRLQVFSSRKSGALEQLASFEHLVGWHRHHPVMCDLLGNGQLAILAVGSSADGDLTIRAHRLDGSLFGNRRCRSRLPICDW